MTTTSTEIQIHEFSQGSTGEYMNATIDPIPQAVQRSIASKEFAVIEVAANGEPAIIGRIVPGDEEPDWSVVAMVSCGPDEMGSSAFFYRYFLAEGAENLSRIVAWIEEQNKLGSMPVFDSLKTKVVGQPNISTISAPHSPLSAGAKSWLDSQSTPIIIPPKQRYKTKTINQYLTEKANGQPVAWAFNVEALERVGSFQIIRAASSEAHQRMEADKVSISQPTAPVKLEIHEFSTGIRAERTNVSWVSLGFTGQYMNATIDPIPQTVLRSIANKEFAVAEGAASDEPAIIGRVVPSGGDQPDWSVVAIVSRGRDEKGRSASFYRYFLSEGANNISEIVAWIEAQNQIPVFNPFDTKVVGQPNISTVFAPILPLSLEDESLLSSNSAPIIQAKQAYSLQKINKLATAKAEENGQSVAWAFKVEALEQPGRFQVIQTASEKAYELLQRAKSSISQVTTPVLDEQAIKAAIKGLISSSTVKLEHLQAIAQPLGNNQIPESYWKEIFDGQGATNGIKQGIYSSQMVRLLTLRAIAIPETLAEYLAWLEKGNKQNDNYTVSADFQSKIRNSLSKISDGCNLEVKAVEGIRLLLPKLLKQNVSVEVVAWLLKSLIGLWAKFYGQVKQEIEDDLQLISKLAKGHKDLPFKLTDQNWQSIRKELEVYWRSRSFPPQEKYQCFANLFEQLDNARLSAFFHHVCFGKVPKDVFVQINSTGWSCNVYGVRVEREVTVLDSLLLTIEEVGSKIVPVPIVCVIVLLGLSLGVGIGGFTGFPKYLIDFTKPAASNGTEAEKVDSNKKKVNCPENWSDTIENNAISKLSETKTAINEVVNVLKDDKDIQAINRSENNIINENRIKQEVTNVLNSHKCSGASDNQFNQEYLFGSNQENDILNKQLVQTIYQYQLQQKIHDKVGYINKQSNQGGKLSATALLLKEEAKMNLIKAKITTQQPKF